MNWGNHVVKGFFYVKTDGEGLDYIVVDSGELC